MKHKFKLSKRTDGLGFHKFVCSNCGTQRLYHPVFFWGGDYANVPRSPSDKCKWAPAA